ncbi:MAG: hypothetical protein R3B06_23950 [Kofleriaceae bacterium]
MRGPSLLSFALVAGLVVDAGADDEPGGTPPRHRDATTAEIFAGPFRSPRLFAMPVADVVGAYQLSASGDGSLLQETGLLTSAGVLAVGFGDIAQIEYRHTTAIGIGHLTAPVPAVGVQLQAPLRERPWVPALAIAFRLGVPRRETIAEQPVDEAVTDLYLVSRLQLRGPLAGATIHAGARVSSAKITRPGDLAVTRLMVLPSLGIDVAAAPHARMVAELGLAPQFRFDPALAPTPRVDYGVLGRAGVRWAALPAVTLDASVGYQLEVARGQPADGPGAIVQWDIRLGGEVFIPWGAIACRVTGGFCD